MCNAFVQSCHSLEQVIKGAAPGRGFRQGADYLHLLYKVAETRRWMPSFEPIERVGAISEILGDFETPFPGVGLLEVFVKKANRLGGALVEPVLTTEKRMGSAVDRNESSGQSHFFHPLAKEFSPGRRIIKFSTHQ